MADEKKMAHQEEVDEMEEMETSIVELTDEDGVVTEFEYLTTIEHKGAEYVVLMAPPEEGEEEDDEEGEVVILKIQEDEDGEDIYVSCDNDEEAQEVFDLFIEELDAEEEGE